MPRSLTSFLFLLCLLAAVTVARAQEDSRENIVRDGRVLELHISGQFSETMRQNLVEWITAISGSLRSVYGHWPRRQWRVAVALGKAPEALVVHPDLKEPPQPESWKAPERSVQPSP